MELKRETYKGRKIISEKYSNGVKSYVPFGSNTHIAKTKKEAVTLVKNQIDSNNAKRKAKEDSYSELRFPTLRRVYYKIDSARSTGYGGTKTKASVFVDGKNGLQKLGETSWDTASFKGEESTIIDFLKDKEYMPQKMFPDGYYGWSDAEKYNIKISRL
jgi:hypothetical protein